MKLSIVTLTYDNYDELIKTLNSIPEHPQLELVVINGGVCEETRIFLKSFKGVSVSEKDRGISDAFNKGIKLSSGELIWFLNSGDVLLEKDYPNFCLEHFSKNPNLDFIHGDIVFNHPQKGPLVLKPDHTPPYVPFKHPTLVVKKSLLYSIGFFNEEYKIAMDYDLMFRLLKKNPQGIYYDKNPITLMDGKGISSSHPFLALNENKKILKKHGLFTWKVAFIFYYLYLRVVARFLLKMNQRNDN